ncbi:MAG TPA: glycosyltransferase family 39 protein [Pyrinomonadaceae bacterium]|nr:glycosyltransferase family 39 protein [Pyrinomonadaceae bacterium]
MALNSKWKFLILAGVIHVALTTAIFLIGHFRVMPNSFNEEGIGITFAIDGKTYHAVAVNLVNEWKTHGFTTWLETKAPLHSRLHSLSFMIFGPLFGYNILSSEPLNLFYYLAILACIYLLGRELFDSQTGLFAAAIIAVWPTFLFHSTQLIRDPLSISCLLALMLVLVLVLGREFAWREGIPIGIAGVGLVTVFWLARGNMWNVIVIAVAITLVMLVIRMIRARRIMVPNALIMLLMIVTLVIVPSRLESTSLPGVRPPVTTATIPSTIKQMSGRRAGFRSYTSQASNIDEDVQFSGAGDVMRYLPRAFVIGFFAPFPSMWIEAGSFGRTPRLLSGLETLVMYALYMAAIFGLWRERRSMKVWLVFLVATIGMLALGLVVVNAGALFRIRYVFWMMLIVLAARGLWDRINYLTVRFTNSTNSLTSSSVVSNDAINRTSSISSSQT